MEPDSKCYLCLSDSHTEEVKGEAGQYIDVMCLVGCPQFEISTSAIEKLEEGTLHRSAVLEEVIAIASQDKKPVVGYDAMKKEFYYGQSKAKA